jgi:hypothetical protein
MCLRREGHDRRRAGGDAVQRSCRLAGLLPRVRRTSVRDSPQTDGQLSHQAEAASGVAGAASRCRRRGRQTPGPTTRDSPARWPTSSVPPAIRHVLARGNGTNRGPARTPSGESERPEGYRALCCCGRPRESRPLVRRLLQVRAMRPSRRRGVVRCRRRSSTQASDGSDGRSPRLSLPGNRGVSTSRT